MNNIRKTFIVGGAIVFLVIGISIVRSEFRQISRAESSCGDYGMINRPCSQMPTVAEAEKILNEHKSKVDQIKKVNLGFIDVYVQASESCVGKGIILVSHPSEKDCDSLKQVLGNTFYGVPYKLINN